MQVKIQMVIEHDSHIITEDIYSLVRDELSAETLGMNLNEAKAMMAAIQHTLVAQQIADYVAQHRACACCGKQQAIKSYHTLIYRTLFGKLTLKSPRLYHCACQPQTARSFSLLAQVLPERAAPELLYLSAKWASLMSYGLTAQLLEDVFPITMQSSSVICRTHQVAQRLEAELEEEQLMFIEGCPRDWEALPRPGAPLTVGIDGGYVHAREGTNRKAGWFEVIVGKSMQAQQPTKRFGFVTQVDTKPKRRLHDTLKKQGLQMNQAITFLSDGGDNVRDLQLYLSPQAEHLLDWFHIAMRVTVMTQCTKGIKVEDADIDKALEKIKYYLWHGNTYQALQHIKGLSWTLDEYTEQPKSKGGKLLTLVEDFQTYIQLNSAYIPNYAERYRYGDIISTAFVESTVNEVISKRMVKKQQMRWTRKGAHWLLQVRIKTLNEELQPAFRRWYPKINTVDKVALRLAA